VEHSPVQAILDALHNPTPKQRGFAWSARKKVVSDTLPLMVPWCRSRPALPGFFWLRRSAGGAADYRPGPSESGALSAC
jgi:hypothetical protein